VRATEEFRAKFAPGTEIDDYLPGVLVCVESEVLKNRIGLRIERRAAAPRVVAVKLQFPFLRVSFPAASVDRSDLIFATEEIASCVEELSDAAPKSLVDVQ
jgi:hypothetical protein